MEWLPHLRPSMYLVERESRHHHSLIRVLTNGEGSFGLQEVMDLLVIHLRKKDKRKRLKEERAPWDSNRALTGGTRRGQT